MWVLIIMILLSYISLSHKISTQTLSKLIQFLVWFQNDEPKLSLPSDQKPVLLVQRAAGRKNRFIRHRPRRTGGTGSGTGVGKLKQRK